MGFEDKKLGKAPVIGDCFLKVLAALITIASGLFHSPHVYAANDPAIEVGFIPHKALYDIRLSSKKSGVMISNLSGKMMYEWHSSCDGWVSNYQFDMLYEYIEMPAARITSDVSTFESFDGKSFNFSAQRKKDNHIFEQFRGATVAGEGGVPQSVLYTMPKDMSYDLPKGTFFPMGHTLGVFKMIKQGKRLYNSPLFDGSGEEGPVNVNTFIGKDYMYQKPETAENSSDSSIENNIDPALVNTRAWDLRLAFFPLDSSDSMSDYEMSVVFHENGVISSMEIEYADFSIMQNLIAIEPVESGCDAPVSGDKGKNKVIK